MDRRLLTTFLLLVVSTLMFAQRNQREWHPWLAPTAGLMYYTGDLKKNALPATGYVHGTLGAQFAMRYKQLLIIQGSYTYGKISGADSLVSRGRASRGFYFESRTHDIEVLAKLTLINGRKQISYKDDPVVHPRLLTGFGLLKFDPYAMNGLQEVDLRSLGTAGQHLTVPSAGYPQPYSAFAFGLKFGAELGVQTGPRTEFNLYCYHTITFTDYLDDVANDPYIEASDLASADDPALLAQYAYPQSSLESGFPTETPGGTRGGASNDGYWVMGFSLGFRLTQQ